MKAWWALVHQWEIYEVVDQQIYDKKSLFMKHIIQSKYAQYLNILSPWDVVDMLHIVQLSLWRNNQIQPYVLHYEKWKSKQSVYKRIHIMQKRHIIKKIDSSYYINPYIYLYSTWDRAIKKWGVMDILYKHFDSESVYNDFQKQLLEKQIKKEK